MGIPLGMCSDELQLRREVTRRDMERMQDWMRDEQVTEYLNEDQNIGAKLERTIRQSTLPIFTPQLNRNGRFFLLTLPRTGPVGFLRLAAKDEAAEIVIVIGESGLWGRGYGLRGVNKGLRHAFFDWRKNEVIAKIHKDNDRSKRVFRKAGFTKDVDLEQEEKFSIQIADVL